MKTFFSELAIGYISPLSAINSYNLTMPDPLPIGQEIYFIIPSLPPGNEVCEGYVFTPVCQSFCSQAEGCLPQCMLGHTHNPLLGRHLAGQTPHSVQCMLGDTGNKRAVRFLLECILVDHTHKCIHTHTGTHTHGMLQW